MEVNGHAPVGFARRPQWAAWLVIGLAALIAWPLGSWRGGSMEPGQVVPAAITLITSDREELACGMDRPVGSWRCAFSALGEPSDPPPPAGQVLAPYQTVSGAMFLLPALFDQPALAARYQAEPPAGVARNDLRRFVASCQLRLRERVHKLSVRWEREAPWNPASDVWAADVVGCRVEE